MTLQRAMHMAVDRVLRLPGIRNLANRQSAAEFVANRSQNMFWGVFDTWQHAEESARRFGMSGYDNAASAELYLARTRIDQHDYPALYWLYRSMDEGMRSVFDLGGSTGIKFFAFREALAGWPDLAWTVQDVPAMVERGRKLVTADNPIRNLEFTDRLEEGSGKDILFASGVLQYLPISLGDLISTYQKLPRRIIINTAAIHPAIDFFTVNSIGTAFCPYRVQTQATLIRGLGRLGYRLRETWINPDKPLTIPFDPEHSLQHYSGYTLDLKS